ncbi:unnamed protein product [Adineta ricciae]|uniref:Uncharacterized protein n=1 Tax=Adineta ricciae TaxID=249248 RepID=A0A814Z3H9_ADIRI|nr:unnamed protein product [Adineta ricciae]CAF1571500.1 unnamed protein product [Adineta ricciae]
MGLFDLGTCLLYAIATTSALVDSCTLGNCKKIMAMLKTVYKISDLNMDEAMLEIQLRGNGKTGMDDIIFSNKNEMEQAIAAIADIKRPIIEHYKELFASTN